MTEQFLLTSEWKQVTSFTLGELRKVIVCNQSSGDTTFHLALKTEGISSVRSEEFLVCGQTLLANETLIFTFDLVGIQGKVLMAKSGNGQVSCLVSYV